MASGVWCPDTGEGGYNERLLAGLANHAGKLKAKVKGIGVLRGIVYGYWMDGGYKVGWAQVRCWSMAGRKIAM